MGAAVDLSHLHQQRPGMWAPLEPSGERKWVRPHARPGEQGPSAGCCCSQVPFLRLQRWMPGTQDNLPVAL